MAYEFLFLRALLLTVSVELGTALFLSRISRLKVALLGGAPLTLLLICVPMASILTLPYVWFIFPFLIKNRWLFMIAAELFAWLMEALFYRYSLSLKTRSALAFSFILNFCSVLAGLVFFGA